MVTTIQARVMPDALRRAAAGGTGQAADGMGFFDLAARETARKEGAPTGFETNRMDLVQYRQYLSNRISEIPIDPSRALESFRVKISDAAFAAMQADPDYEAWVLERLRADWAEPAEGLAGGLLTTYSVGADRESFQTSTVDLGAAAKELKELDDDGETFWERRHRRHEEYMELIQREQFLRRLRNGSVSTAEYLLSGLL